MSNELLKPFLNQVLQGNALDVLKQLPDNSIDCLVTSSPYYALRTYGTPPQIWQPKPNEFTHDFATCEHAFVKTDTTLHSGRGGKSQKFSEQEPVKDTPISYAFCAKCGAWRGELGQEPNPDLFLDHLLLIFAQVKRVLKPTGTCWVNLADTYSGSGGAGGDYNEGGIKEGQPRYKQARKQRIPRKSLMNVPKKFAIRMVEDLGFILRNDIIWHKPNVLPQSAKDKFTPDFEYVFFFVKSEKYYFETQYEPLSDATLKEIQKAYTGQATKDYDAASAQNPSDTKRRILKKFAPIGGVKKAGGDNATYSGNEYVPNLQLGRQKRTVWRISTKPFKGAHFAVYPKDLIRPMLQAGCPAQVCNKCGAMSRTTYEETRVNTRPGIDVLKDKSGTDADPNKELHKGDLSKYRQKIIRTPTSVATCNCNAGFHAGVVLDPFIGSGTARLVAQELGLDFIGIELKPEYAEMARTRRFMTLPVMTCLFVQRL